MTAPGFSVNRRCGASLEGVKEETHRRIRFRRWVWKLGLAYCQFLPSPEAPVVLVLIIVVDVVAEIVVDDIIINDIKGRIEMARDNIPGIRVATEPKTVNCKIARIRARC